MSGLPSPQAENGKRPLNDENSSFTGIYSSAYIVTQPWACVKRPPKPSPVAADLSHQEGHVIELLRPGLEGLSAAKEPIAQDLRRRCR